MKSRRLVHIRTDNERHVAEPIQFDEIHFQIFHFDHLLNVMNCTSIMLSPRRNRFDQTITTCEHSKTDKFYKLVFFKDVSDEMFKNIT